MLVHGLMDENVHFRHTGRLCQVRVMMSGHADPPAPLIWP